MTNRLSLIHKNIDYYSRKALIALRSLRFSLTPVMLTRPIFVVGCSRAGTTLIYKTLSESRALGSLHKETHDFWSVLHPPAERNWDSHHIPPDMACDSDRIKVSKLFYTHTGTSHIVDKNNQNGLSIAYLHRLFPDAHFVYIKRNAGDNLNSLIYGWQKSSEFGTWANALPEKVAIDGGKYQKWCFFLAEGWRDYLDAAIEEVCAFQYKSMNEAILAAKEGIPESQWHELKYEAILGDAVATFRELFLECGLPFDRHMEDHCRNVIDKPYNAFSEIRVDKWKSGENRARIERVLPSLETTIQRMGYAL